jgi:hypothetical protein
MLRLLADVNLNYEIVRGVRRRLSDVDLITVREAEMLGILDLVITHILVSLVCFYYEPCRNLGG